MDIVKDIPAKTVAHVIERITLNITDKVAYVQIEDPPEHQRTIEVDIFPLFIEMGATVTQKNIVRGFIKAIIAKAMEINASTVPEVFSEV